MQVIGPTDMLRDIIQPTLIFLTCSLQWQHGSQTELTDEGLTAEEGVSMDARGWRFARETTDGSSPGFDAKPVTINPELIRHYQSRERKKQARIVQILIDVNDIMGMRNRANFSAARALPPRDVASLQNRFAKSYELDAKEQEEDGTNSRISRTILLPACRLTADRNRSSNGLRPKGFRLYFNIVPPERILKPETIRIKSANLLLRRRPMKDLAAEVKVTGDLKMKDKKRKVNANSTQIPPGILKVQIHEYSTSKSERRTRGKRLRERGKRGGADNRKAVRTISFNPYNSSEWLKVGLLKTTADWYRLPVRQPGLQVTVFNSKNQPVDPFQVFYDFNCDLLQLPSVPDVTLPPSADISAEETDKSGKAKTESDGEQRNSTSAHDDASSFPYLEVVTVASPKKRDARKQRHLVRQREKPCRMRTERVTAGDKRFPNLTDIIAPLHFHSGVCVGSCQRCGVPWGQRNPTDRMKAEISSNCGCRPVKKMALDALHVNDGKILILKRIPDAIVTKCGCRRLT